MRIYLPFITLVAATSLNAQQVERVKSDAQEWPLGSIRHQLSYDILSCNRADIFGDPADGRRKQWRGNGAVGVNLI